jgi:hypothetical protein
MAPLKLRRPTAAATKLTKITEITKPIGFFGVFVAFVIFVPPPWAVSALSCTSWASRPVLGPC